MRVHEVGTKQGSVLSALVVAGFAEGSGQRPAKCGEVGKPVWDSSAMLGSQSFLPASKRELSDPASRRLVFVLDLPGGGDQGQREQLNKAECPELFEHFQSPALVTHSGGADPSFLNSPPHNQAPTHPSQVCSWDDYDETIKHVHQPRL